MVSTPGKKRVHVLCGAMSSPSMCGIPGITPVTRGRWCKRCLKSLSKALTAFLSESYPDLTVGVLYHYHVVSAEVLRALDGDAALLAAVGPGVESIPPLWDRYSKSMNNRIFAIWGTLMDRCYDPTHPDFNQWGGRGIRVDKRWHNFEQFVNDCPPGVTGVYPKRGSSVISNKTCTWKTSNLSLN